MLIISHWLDCEKFLDNAEWCYTQVILVLCEKYNGADMRCSEILRKAVNACWRVVVAIGYLACLSDIMHEIDGIKISDVGYDKICLNCRYWR